MVATSQSTELVLDKDTEAGVQLLVQLLRTHSDPKAALSAALGAILALGQPAQVRSKPTRAAGACALVLSALKRSGLDLHA